MNWPRTCETCEQEFTATDPYELSCPSCLSPAGIKKHLLELAGEPPVYLDDPERIQEIYLKFTGETEGHNGWHMEPHELAWTLIARMEEEIAYAIAGNYEPFFFEIMPEEGNEYDVMRHQSPSRLEATYAAWKAVKEQTE